MPRKKKVNRGDTSDEDDVKKSNVKTAKDSKDAKMSDDLTNDAVKKLRVAKKVVPTIDTTTDNVVNEEKSPPKSSMKPFVKSSKTRKRSLPGTKKSIVVIDKVLEKSTEDNSDDDSDKPVVKKLRKRVSHRPIIIIDNSDNNEIDIEMESHSSTSSGNGSGELTDQDKKLLDELAIILFPIDMTGGKYSEDGGEPSWIDYDNEDEEEYVEDGLDDGKIHSNGVSGRASFFGFSKGDATKAGTSLLRLKKGNKKSKAMVEMEEKLIEAEKSVKAYQKEHATDYENQDMRKQILLTDCPIPIKALILRKYDELNKRGSGLAASADKSKFHAWIKELLTLPFNRTRALPVLLSDGPNIIKDYLGEVRKKLDNAVAGHVHAKEEIIDYIARIISNPKGRGNVLALVGSKGTGKTRLIKRGVAEALARPFHVINLGGLNDVHVLTGHDMTYTGAKCGRLAQILIQSKCDNPVVYLDEIDKIQSSSDKGMEIFRVLTHILDEEQAFEFHDEYFDNVPIDLSKILFVASLNNLDDVEPILRDRLKVIRLDKLSHDEKMCIAYDYILPELCSLVNIDLKYIDIPHEVMRYIIQQKTALEDGCRQMKKKLETIIQKLNTMFITQSGLYSANNTTLVLTKENVDTLLKHVEEDYQFPSAHMYS